MDCEAVEDEIVGWLYNSLEETGTDGFVVGVSGGVDSAVTSTLCAETGGSTVALSMPQGCLSDGDRRAMNHQKWLEDNYSNVRTEEFRIDQMNEAFVGQFEEKGLDEGLTIANMQSRVRMTALYAYANTENLLVAGTGNKVEDEGVGFFTKFGDGGVDLLPICDLLKTEVWELAEYLGINEEIVEATPTDGLWADNRSDEEQLGMSYPEIEKYMGWYEEGRRPSDVGDEGERKKYMQYINQHESTRHKMSMPPICDLEDVK